MGSKETHIPTNQRYKVGDRWSECPDCGDDILVNKMLWDSIRNMWVCPDCGVDEPGHRPVFHHKLPPLPTHQSEELITEVYWYNFQELEIPWDDDLTTIRWRNS